MIVQTFHTHSLDEKKFNEDLKEYITKTQSETVEVEVLYSTTTYYSSIHYSALCIARQKEVK